MSRKAGLLTCGVRWVKYNCDRVEETSKSYFLGAQQAISSGWDTSGKTYFQGFSSYTFNSAKGTVYASGDQSNTHMANPGVVYEDNGTSGKSIYGYACRSDGFWHTFTRTVREETTYSYSYYVRENVGIVRAAAGEYPDAKQGYTYVTVNKGYTIMKAPGGKYYAYKKA